MLKKTPVSSNSGSRDRLRDPVQVFCPKSKFTRKGLSYQFKHIFTSLADQKEISDRVY